MRLRYLKSLTALTACLMLCASVHAVPMRRQPGIHIPEYLMPTDRDDPALWTSQSPYMFNRAAATPGAYATTDIPRTGEKEYPLVLVNFQDLHFFEKDTAALLRHYECVFNEHGYPDSIRFIYKETKYRPPVGSVSDYFHDQSYGKYKPTFKIIGPITVSHGYEYYGSGVYDNVRPLVKEVLDTIIARNLADISGYARNGMIDQISIIYAGRGENYGGADPKTIWPQAGIAYFDRNDAKIYGKGIRRAKYACSAELFFDSDSLYDGIGTFCHEFSHTLGLPDFYNTENNHSDEESSSNNYDAAMGYWSLMDYGCYENGGFCPVGYTAFEKYSLGWLELEEISGPGTLILRDISQTPDPESGIHTAYRLNTGDDSQFLILENHIKTGWYRHHRSRGLMVTAVDYNQGRWIGNQANDGSTWGYHILPADNNYDVYTSSGDLYPYKRTDSLGVTHIVDSITTKGEPQFKAGTSYPSFSIYDITLDSNYRLSFNVRYDLPTEVKETPKQEISIDVFDGKLTVCAPSGSRIQVYDISGKPVSQVTATSAVQQITLPGHGIWIVKCGNKTRKVRL